MPARKVKVWRTHKSLAIRIPRQMAQELGLVPGQRMLFTPYKNGLKAIPLEPHQVVIQTAWTKVRNLCTKEPGLLRVVLPSKMCRTLGLKARDTIKIRLNGQDGKRFFVLIRSDEFIAAVAPHDKPSIHLVARPVTADGKVDETCPCIRKILPYQDAVERLGGLEIYDAGEFAEALEAHLRTAGPSHDAPLKPCEPQMVEP